jgi:hypothetical protein
MKPEVPSTPAVNPNSRAVASGNVTRYSPGEIVSTSAGELACASRAHPASSIAKFHCSWANISVISLS